MAVDIKITADYFKDHLSKQDIPVTCKSMEEIDRFEKNSALLLPDDFRIFYSVLNGMEFLYPNDIDKEGFLFYPLEAIISAADEFDSKTIPEKNIIIFAEYMHKSWWYGIDVADNKNYVIGIIPHKDSFQPITTSLSEFIEFYIADAPCLYEY